MVDSEAHLRTVIDHANAGLVRTDATGRVQFVNGRWCRVLGFAESELLGVQLVDFIDPAFRWDTLEASSRLAAGGPAVVLEARYRRKDGSVLTASTSLSAVHGDAGRFDGLVAVMLDVTERARADAAIRAREAELAAAINLTPFMIMRCNRDLTYRFVSTSYAQLVGRRAEDIVGRRIVDIVGEQAFQTLRPHVERVLAGHEVRFTRLADFGDGARELSVVYTPERAPSGAVIGWIASIVDITERKGVEDALRRSEEQLASVSNAVPALISYVDTEGRYRFCNRTYTEWFGVRAEDIVGRSMREVLGEQAWQTVEPHLQAALAGETADFEAEARYARGRTRWIHAIYTPDRDGHGRVVGVVVMVSDITARKRAEEALREEDRRKDEFLAVLAHELRNPLAPIRTGLELLRISGHTPGALERVRPVLERQVAHMVRLIDDLLDVSRITSGKIQLQRQPTPLAELVRNAVDANRAAIEAAGLAIEVTLPETPCLLDVDPTRFVQVLSNLLHNTTKFTEPGGRVTMSGVIAGDPAHPLLALTVRDTGIGMASDLLPRVFDLFVQGQVGKGGGGLGIGLALARQLVELHGGQLVAESEGPGRGSAFTVHLPVLTWAALPTEPPTTETRACANRRVLIVDDNIDAADTLAELVTAMGGESMTAHSGEAGVRAAETFRPEVILLDIGMPGMDGYETCRQLRASCFGRAAFIAALTGWGQEQDRQRALAEGFDAHLTKPADPRALVALLARGLAP
jgi:PAS domain S-box-containing protein